MTDETLKYLFALAPADIVEWYKQKGLAFSWDWRDVWQDAHARSFTAAKVMKLDILQELKDEVDKIFSEGITFEQFQQDLKPALKKLGWWGKVKAKDVPGYKPAPDIDPEKVVQLGSPARLKIIFNTNSRVAYSAARYKSKAQNIKNRPYWRYNQLDRRTKRKVHAVYAGKVFMWDDPIWDKIYPPSDWNCGCSVTALSHAEFEAAGGKLSYGKDFPIVTGKGWDYNPGKSYYKPDQKKYDNDIFIQYKMAGGEVKGSPHAQ